MRECRRLQGHSRQTWTACGHTQTDRHRHSAGSASGPNQSLGRACCRWESRHLCLNETAWLSHHAAPQTQNHQHQPPPSQTPLWHTHVPRHQQVHNATRNGADRNGQCTEKQRLIGVLHQLPHRGGEAQQPGSQERYEQRQQQAVQAPHGQRDALLACRGDVERHTVSNTTGSRSQAGQAVSVDGGCLSNCLQIVLLAAARGGLVAGRACG